jgi:hypothetical protein
MVEEMNQELFFVWSPVVMPPVPKRQLDMEFSLQEVAASLTLIIRWLTAREKGEGVRNLYKISARHIGQKASKIPNTGSAHVSDS